MKKWILKKEMAEILKTYSARKNEFEPLSGNEYSYQSKYIRGYMITFQEELNGQFKTGRVKVSHTQSSGLITFYDIWERSKENNFQFRFRNPVNCPFSDIEYIKDLEEENKQLKQIIANLREQQTVSKELNSDTKIDEEYKEEINRLKEELKEKEDQLAETVSQKLNSDSKLNELQKELDALKVHNKRGAGRKVSVERQNAVKRVKKMIEQGSSDKTIMTELNISPATYYRYKKEISQINY